MRTAALALALGLSALVRDRSARAQQAPPDRWTDVAPGVRLLERRAQWSDGTSARVLAARVDLCASALAVRVSAPSEGGRTVGAFGRASRALIAINGDYFDRSSLRPTGPSRASGANWSTAAWTHHDSIVAFSPDGAATLRDVSAQGTAPLSALFNAADVQRSDVLSARERVLLGGRPRLSPWVEHDGHRHPRTGLGLSADRRTLWLVVIDGRSRSSAGATVEELAETLRSLGASDGVKLDGGGSSAMFVRGRGVINHPSDGRERVVANHIAVVRAGGRASGARAWCSAR